MINRYAKDGLWRGARTWLVLAAWGATAGCSVVAAYDKCGSGCPGDSAITADVRAAFRQHPELEAPNAVSVQTIDHVVYLTGIVDTGMQRDVAASVASQVPGVKRVVNSIGLESSR